jgi:uncharacterized protein (DUF58 family)
MNPARHLRFAITRNGWLLLGVSAFLYLASLTSQSSLLLLLVGLILGCALANAIVAARAVARLALEPPPVAHVAEGQRLKHPWRVMNRARRGAALIQLESPLGTLGQIPWLPPAATTSLLPEFTYWRRGVFPNAAVTVSSSAPFGLVQASRRQHLAGEVIVHPALYETASPRAAGYDAMVGGRFRGRSLSSSGAHFHGVRPIQPGDPLRQIHWKASAKGLGLMVKTFEEELSGRVAVLLDVTPGESHKALDDAARAAGSLVFAALDEGHHAEWIELGTLHHLLIPPFEDGGELLDALARVEPARDRLTAATLDAAVARISPRSAISLVLTAWNDEAATKADAWCATGRSVTLYLPAGAKTPTGRHSAASILRFEANHVEVVS